MPFFHRVGDVPRKRHVQFRQPDGSLYREELMGEEGFAGDSSLLYHVHSPSATVAVEPLDHQPSTFAENHPLLPRHLMPHRLKVGGDAATGRTPLLGNDDVVMSYAAADEASPLYRNLLGDEVAYLESGAARLETVLGVLDVVQGDYVIVPAGTTHRWVPQGGEPLRMLVFEASGHVAPPVRYLSSRGQFLESAPYCELDIRRPDEPLLVDGEYEDVVVKNHHGYTRYTLARHPFDVVGWFGCMYPWAFNIRDFSPVTGSLHRPPPVHQTFEGPGFVVCSFVPRLFDYHPEAVPVPPFHANVDSDEVLFYADGSFMSRKGSGIEQGSVSLHPAGFIHGPHPGSAEAALGVTGTEETAVMMDTFKPLKLADGAVAIEDAEYVRSWHTNGPE